MTSPIRRDKPPALRPSKEEARVQIRLAERVIADRNSPEVLVLGAVRMREDLHAYIRQLDHIQRDTVRRVNQEAQNV